MAGRCEECAGYLVTEIKTEKRLLIENRMRVVRLNIRGYTGRTLQWEERLDLDARYLNRTLPALAEQHAQDLLDGLLTMVEIEFLDQPDVNQRFFRLGTTREGMVKPVTFEFDRKPD